MSEAKVKIITRTSGGTVTTFYSDDEWNRPGWQSIVTIRRPGYPLDEIIDLLVGQTYEEAGKNHLALCKKITT